MRSSRSQLTASDVRAARAAVETVARRTPILSTRTFSERAGGTVVLKAENLQRTGSFKVRGVAAKLAALGEGLRQRRRRRVGRQPRPGARAAAAARGIPCEVFVPDDAPMAKVEAARAQARGPHRRQQRRRVRRSPGRERPKGGLAFVHPFDDPAIVAGQGSLGLELLEDVPDLAQGRRAGRRRRAVRGHRAGDQGGAAGRRDRRGPGGRVRAVPGVDAAGEPIEAASR